ncbi:hypothetical protein MP638_001249 [Amoeboaphelidium occidentale]|nr:hypothetical protein MP638_001249 [Amoeboaphelidium occidentale]
MKVYELIINGEINTFVSREIFDKLPTDSMLFTLLRDDQELKTQNSEGMYELTLDHPKLFNIAIQSAFDESFGFSVLSETLKSAGYDFRDGLDGLAETMSYLGLLPNKHVDVIIASTSSAERYNQRLVKYQPLLERELQNYGTEMIRNFAKKLQKLVESFMFEEITESPFVAESLQVVLAIPLTKREVKCMVACMKHHRLGFSFYFDYLPLDSTKNLVGGDFLKIYLDNQPEVFRAMVNDRLVSLIVFIIKMVSKYDYNVESVDFNRLIARLPNLADRLKSKLQYHRSLLTADLRNKSLVSTSEGMLILGTCF